MTNQRRSRYSVMIDSVLGTVMGSLVLGFFLVLWTTSETLKSTLRETRMRLDDTRERVVASQEVVAEEVARLRTGIRRLETRIEDMSDEVAAYGVYLGVSNGEMEPVAPEPDGPSALKLRAQVEEKFLERYQAAQVKK